MISKRVEKLRNGLLVDKNPVRCTLATLHTDSFRKTEGQPEVIRVAKAFANGLQKVPIFIEDGELIVGNTASVPRGLELSFAGELWPGEVLALFNTRGIYSMSEEEMTLAEPLNEYWRGRNYTSRLQAQFDDRIWPAVETGVVLPQRFKGNESQYVGTKSGSGLGIGTTQLISPDFERVIAEGLIAIKEEAEQALRTTKVANYEALQKTYFLQAVVISIDAVIAFADRFAVLAHEKAAKEKNKARKKELEEIARICKHVPAYPARTFHEGLQALWFLFDVLSPAGTMGLGRLDQYLYPLFKDDKEHGRMDDKKTLELLQCLRIKFSEIMVICSIHAKTGNTGNVAWLNATLGGQTPDGKDAANDLTYLILEAARTCRTPHHTVTLRVHEKTPEELMVNAIETVQAGTGMPAFVGDKSYIRFFMRHGVALETARDYILVGCVDGGLPHKSRIRSFGFVIAPMVLELTLNNGTNPRYSSRVGLETGDTFRSFDDLLEAFKKQMRYFMDICAEVNHFDMLMTRESDPNALLSALMDGRIKRGKELNEEPLNFDQEEVVCPVGLINVADSLAAIKKLIFEEKKFTMDGLKAALAANWQGDYTEMRKSFLAAPKFGNDDDYVDSIAQDLYKFFGETAATFDDVFGRKQKPSAISVVGHWQAGILTGALPDGRCAFVALADGSMSPMRGCDAQGPTAVIKSASKIDQSLFQGTLMNMKFHPSALKNHEDRKKLASLVKTYLTDLGGEHIQFNIIGKETLEDAQKHPENYRDLIVRVAGFSAYYVQLDKGIQDEIMGRMEHRGVGC